MLKDHTFILDHFTTKPTTWSSLEVQKTEIVFFLTFFGYFPRNTNFPNNQAVTLLSPYGFNFMPNIHYN